MATRRALVLSALSVLPLLALRPASAAADAAAREAKARGYFTDTVLQAQDGRSLRFYSDVLKDQVVLVNFWASWCIPCRDEAEALEVIWQNYKDRGLVVVSSCGHAGIVNTVRTAVEVSGVKKVHAALGGFHLYPAPDDYVSKTVAELKTIDPDVIIPMHCSGPTLVEMLRSDLADRLIISSTGTEFVFGA